MKPCHVLDLLITPFIDGACTAEERATVLAHLATCAACRRRVDAESTASQLLHAHAAVARTMGVEPTWRPRVWWLGRPLRPAHRTAYLLAAIVVVGVALLWVRPATVSAVGVIGDSWCQHRHRFTTPYIDDLACTLGCVARGAAFVLVSNDRIYAISNQDLPALTELANRRVHVTGTMQGDAIRIATMAED